MISGEGQTVRRPGGLAAVHPKHRNHNTEIATSQWGQFQCTTSSARPKDFHVYERWEAHRCSSKSPAANAGADPGQDGSRSQQAMVAGRLHC